MALRSGQAFVLAVLLVGCAPAAPRPLGWQVRFADEDLRARARALEVEIRAGDCAGSPIWSLAFAVSDPPASMGPPELGPGSYGFAVAARDASCARYAIGCAALDLPLESDATVVVTLEAFLGGMACSASLCSSGLCESSDGGVGDGGAPCPGGRGDCNGVALDGCETPLDTVEACGSCGTACALDHATPACTAGRCAITACAAGWADCNGVVDDGCETSLRSADHCGACGAGCQLANASESCQAMRCELVSCHPGFADCDGTVGNGCETSLVTASDCGACGSACSALTPLCGIDAVSGARACVAACAAPAPTACGTSCVDLSSEPQACGACGTSCRFDHAAGRCVAGSCALAACDELWASCNGADADGCERSLATSTDCGACGGACAATSARVSCATGTCVVDSCAAGLGDCDGLGANGCEADLAAPSTCGDCGTSCAASTPVCGRLASGDRACLPSCAAPDPDRCGDRCFDTSTDLENCGGCGRRCTLANASTACAGGECVIGGCIGGFGDCDGIDANGCEARVASDPANCGGCGVACVDRPGSSPTCVDSACAISCDAGFGDCDGDETDGCETRLDSAAACGACGRPCDPPNATGSCTGGTCRIMACDAGFADCDGSAGNGCEASLARDRMNCGMCGMRCSGPARDCCEGTCGTCG